MEWSTSRRTVLKLPVLGISPELLMSLAREPQPKGLRALDAIIEAAVRDDVIPGAVVWVGWRGRILYRKAYGWRALVPEREPMTEDTIFDLASLTKVVATAPAIMWLFERGLLRLNDPVTQYLPEFQGGKSRITVRQLLTHFSGLKPDLELETDWSGYEVAIQKALQEPPAAEPGERFIYSDINFILLGEIVRRLSGQPLDEFTREKIFEPLGMHETCFRPPRQWLPRIAPTEQLPGQSHPLRGVVHDPTARRMGGVAGHAGLFSTAHDLSRFAQMMLGLGEFRGARILQPLTVRKMTSPQSPADQYVLRGLGWDIDSAYSANRGELFPLGSYGHTGFTGTSLWIDPTTQSYVILLTNSVHPRVRPPINSLRSRVATLVAAQLGIDLPGVALTGYNETLVAVRRRAVRNGRVYTGLDVAAENRFALLRGQRVGLITNHTGRSRSGARNVELMLDAGVKLVALFAPEHGLSGTIEDRYVPDGKDEATGLPVWSLYRADTKRPLPELLQQVDTLVFDIQDIGTRFYTYLCTMLYAMESAAESGRRFVVFDRPNPITGIYVEGPTLQPEFTSFIGCVPGLPLRHGMTAGEIALMERERRNLKVDLEVVKLRGWERGDWFDATGLVWINPSPNIRSLEAALLYPAVALLEASRNYSVGRGTDAPFLQVGADWIHGSELADYLNRRHIPGIRAYPVRLRPTRSVFAGQEIEGVRFVVLDREVVQVARLGLEIASAIQRLYPDRISWNNCEQHFGDARVIQWLREGEDPRLLADRLAAQAAPWARSRQRWLLY